MKNLFQCVRLKQRPKGPQSLLLSAVTHRAIGKKHKSYLTEEPSGVSSSVLTENSLLPSGLFGVKYASTSGIMARSCQTDRQN